MKGYDHAFLLDAKGDASQPAAQVWSQDGKLQMTVYTSAPALQFYSGNYLGGTRRRRRSPTPTGRDWRWRRIPAGFAEPSAMAAAGLCITSGPGVRQPDGISVYRPIIASALHQGRCSSPPSSLPPLFQQPALFSVTKGQKITCVLQAPYTAPLFSLWLGISIAVRQITAI